MNTLFAPSYADARAAFLQGARAVNARLSQHPIAVRGPQQEELALDVAELGPAAPRTLVLITSGVHGIEGYAGSALQQLWLREFAGALPDGVGVLLVHAVNPHGFAHGRRVNENNVDLNRNALAQFPGPANPGYARVDGWINPASPVRAWDGFFLRGLWHLLSMGKSALQQAVAGGQYDFPKGLFYGGRGTEESLRILAHVLATAAARKPQIVLHIDLHTGLGERGSYEMLLDYAPQSSEFAAFQRWFDPAHIVSDAPGAATNYAAHGMVAQLVARTFAPSRVSAAVIDFGTVPLVQSIKALRDENRLAHFGCADPRRAQQIRDALREAFYPSDDAWRNGLLQHGRAIFTRLENALARGLA